MAKGDVLNLEMFLLGFCPVFVTVVLHTPFHLVQTIQKDLGGGLSAKLQTREQKQVHRWIALISTLGI